MRAVDELGGIGTAHGGGKGLRFTRLGKTSLQVSALGFGASTLGEEYGPIDPVEARYAVDARRVVRLRPEHVSRTAQFVKKELDVLGSRNAGESDFRTVIDHVRGGGLPIDDLVTRVAPIDEAGEALVRWAADRALVTRIHITLDATKK